MFLTIPVLLDGMTSEAEVAQAIRDAKYEFGKQLQHYVTKWIQQNLNHIKIPEPKAAN